MSGHQDARHILAAARGTQPDSVGSRCICCGASPFPTSGPAKRIIGPTFTDYEALLDPAAPDVCAGCVSILSGRPGDDPPPLRTLHCLAVEGVPATYPASADLAAILRAPPAGRFVLLWAASRQRHACLRAQVSTAERLLIGADTATIEYVPARDVPVLDAVEALRAHFASDAIASGAYHPKAVNAMGPARWVALEAVVAPHRGTPLLDLLCAVARKSEAMPPEEEMIDPADDLASDLLAHVARGSNLRSRDGKRFWGAMFARRLERHRRRPLAACLSRLMRSCDVPAENVSAQALARRLSDLTAEETAAAERAIRERADLCLVLAYDKATKGAF